MPGCRARAKRGELFCSAHAQGALDTLSSEQAEADGTPQAALHSFYASAFSAEELSEIARQLESPQRSTEMEVAVMRVMIRRVMERIGEEDPLKALPLIRQGVDAICRALRTERVLSGEASDSLSAAFAVALREIGEELGIGND